MHFLYPTSPAIGLPSRGLLIGLFGMGCLLATLAGVFPLYVIGGGAVLLLLRWLFLSPLSGMTFVLAISALFIRSTEDITPYEIAYTVLFTIAILGWFAGRLLQGQPVTETKTDTLLVWFLVLCVVSIVPTVILGNNPFKWLRELVPLLLFLPYFLVVNLLNRKVEVYRICLAYAVVCLSIGTVNIYDYINNVSNAKFLWEILAGRRAPGEPLFYTTLITLIVVLVYGGLRGWKRFAALGLMTFCTVALAITFSRGYWVASAIALSVAFALMAPAMRWRLLRYGAILSLFGVTAIYLFMDQLLFDILTAMGDRLATVFSSSLDVSVRNRLVESAAAFDKILGSPIWGYGFGAYYRYRALIPSEMPTWYVHNVYLYLWMKIGLIGLVVFLIWYLNVILHGYQVYRRLKDPLLKPLLLSVVSLLISMIPLAVTSPQFIQKDAILFVAFGAGLIECLYRSNRPSGTLT